MSSMKIQSFCRRCEGTSAVEFALIAPVFVLILMGMTAFGIYLGASHSIQQIAADAARSAVAGLSADERETMVAGFVRERAGGYPFVEADRLAVSVVDSDDGRAVSISVRYDARNLPIWRFAAGLPLPPVEIGHQSVITVGGV